MESMVQNQGCLYTFTRRNFENSFLKSKKIEQYNNKEGIILTLIADDHPYLLHGVEMDLNKDSKIKIVGKAISYDELIDKATELQPDVILMDLKMPGRDKHDLKLYIPALKAVGKSKIVIFSNESGWARIHRCLEMGASAYIEKGISIGRLAEFIHLVYEKEELLIFTTEELPKIQFSSRQEEILHYIADGKENNEIALLLNIEVKTVQSYVNEIKSKLSEAFGIIPIRPRTLLLLTSKLGFGNKT